MTAKLWLSNINFIKFSMSEIKFEKGLPDIFAQIAWLRFWVSETREFQAFVKFKLFWVHLFKAFKNYDRIFLLADYSLNYDT